MTMNRRVTFFHAPNTRSAGVRFLLEELAADYDLHVVNMKAGEQRSADYLALNPMGKVPALRHGDTMITEQAAVYMYLAELYPVAGLAPAIGDPLRGAYLRWMVFYGSCFEPALLDVALKREAAPPAVCAYGSYGSVIQTLNEQLTKGPYILGERFTAADVLWGSALAWTAGFKLIEATPVIQAYINRIGTRPAAARARAKDAELLAST